MTLPALAGDVILKAAAAALMFLVTEWETIVCRGSNSNVAPLPLVNDYAWDTRSKVIETLTCTVRGKEWHCDVTLFWIYKQFFPYCSKSNVVEDYGSSLLVFDWLAEVEFALVTVTRTFGSELLSVACMVYVTRKEWISFKIPLNCTEKKNRLGSRWVVLIK